MPQTHALVSDISEPQAPAPGRDFARTWRVPDDKQSGEVRHFQRLFPDGESRLIARTWPQVGLAMPVVGLLLVVGQSAPPVLATWLLVALASLVDGRVIYSRFSTGPRAAAAAA